MDSLGAPDHPVRRALARVLAVGLFSLAGDAAANDTCGALRQFSGGQSIRSVSGRVLANGRQGALAAPIDVCDGVEIRTDAEIAFIVGPETMAPGGDSRIVVSEPKSQIKGALRLMTGIMGSLLSGGATKEPMIVTSTIGIRN